MVDRLVHHASQREVTPTRPRTQAEDGREQSTPRHRFFGLRVGFGVFFVLS
jgi:hypothetical protein